ncbi:hypothetical protein J6590_070810 [Homalodisca vitripennis]|nr:hypothetical protein J6590_070810 [Homalodisca vitripennis]
MKNKCNECDAIEDDCDLEIKSLQNELSLCKQENVILRDQVNSVETDCNCGTKSKECSGSDVTHNTNTVILELEVNISDMEAERGRFLTTVQVLEANINYLNSEIVRLEGEVLSGARYVSLWMGGDRCLTARPLCFWSNLNRFCLFTAFKWRQPEF